MGTAELTDAGDTDSAGHWRSKVSCSGKLTAAADQLERESSESERKRILNGICKFKKKFS